MKVINCDRSKVRVLKKTSGWKLGALIKEQLKQRGSQKKDGQREKKSFKENILSIL